MAWQIGEYTEVFPLDPQMSGSDYMYMPCCVVFDTTAGPVTEEENENNLFDSI